jgi:transposase
LALSKRGDVYVRIMLIHGARAVIARSTRSSWIERLLQRRPYSVVVIALTNKLARTA